MSERVDDPTEVTDSITVRVSLTSHKRPTHYLLTSITDENN